MELSGKTFSEMAINSDRNILGFYKYIFEKLIVKLMIYLHIEIK